MEKSAALLEPSRFLCHETFWTSIKLTTDIYPLIKQFSWKETTQSSMAVSKPSTMVKWRLLGQCAGQIRPCCSQHTRLVQQGAGYSVLPMPVPCAPGSTQQPLTRGCAVGSMQAGPNAMGTACSPRGQHRMCAGSGMAWSGPTLKPLGRAGLAQAQHTTRIPSLPSGQHTASDPIHAPDQLCTSHVAWSISPRPKGWIIQVQKLDPAWAVFLTQGAAARSF